MVESNNNELIGFIASTVETIRDEVKTIRGDMVTRSAFDATTAAIRGDIEQVHLRLTASNELCPRDLQRSKAN